MKPVMISYSPCDSTPLFVYQSKAVQEQQERIKHILRGHELTQLIAPKKNEANK